MTFKIIFMKEMCRIIISLFFIINCQQTKAQSTFNKIFKDSLSDHCVRDAVETIDGGFVLVNLKESYNPIATSSELVKLDRNGNVLLKNEIKFEGLPSGFLSICNYSETEFLLSGFIRSGMFTNLWLCIIDTSLNVLQSKSVPIHGYNLYHGRIFKNHNGDFICFGTLEDTTSYKQNYAFAYKFSPDLDSLRLKVFSDYWAWGLDLIERNDWRGYYFIGIGFVAGGSSEKIITLTEEFDMVKSTNLPDISNMSNISYSDQKHLIATGERIYDWPSTEKRDIGVLRYDTLFNLLQSKAFGKKDTEDCPGFTKNIAVSSLNSISIGGTANINFSAIYANQPSWFMLNNVDTSLSLKWQKFFGGDGYYTLWGMIPTKDSGCLMYGTFWDYQHIAEYVNYISVIKVNKDGLLLGVDGEPSTLMKDVIIYPNPGNDHIWAMTQLPETSIEFCNITGKTVLTQPLLPGRTQINTSELTQGMYIYRVFNKTRQIQTGKWIKN